MILNVSSNLDDSIHHMAQLVDGCVHLQLSTGPTIVNTASVGKMCCSDINTVSLCLKAFEVIGAQCYLEILNF